MLTDLELMYKGGTQNQKNSDSETLPVRPDEMEPDSATKKVTEFADFGGIQVRLAAFAIDILIVSAATIAFFALLPDIPTMPALLFIFSALYWTLGIWMFNCTLGMIFFRLRVLSITGDSCGFWQALWRSIVLLSPFAFLLTGQIMNVMNGSSGSGQILIGFSILLLISNSLFIGIRKNRRGINDLVCGTIVIQKKSR